MNIKADEDMSKDMEELRKLAMLEMAGFVADGKLSMGFLEDEHFIRGVMFGMSVASERFMQVVGPDLREEIKVILG
jgi:hypothetical protein